MIRNICYANAKNYLAFPGVTDGDSEKSQAGEPAQMIIRRRRAAAKFQL